MFATSPLTIEEALEDTLVYLVNTPASKAITQVVPRRITNKSGRIVRVADTTIWPILQYNRQPLEGGGERFDEAVIDVHGDLMVRVVTLAPGKRATCCWATVIQPQTLAPQFQEAIISGLEKLRQRFQTDA